MNRFLTILLTLLAAGPARAAIPARPNVLLVMADDLGYQDLSCYGSKMLKTPVLDQLAADGIRLTAFYAGATVCTPSRMALLTGAYPPRLGWRGGVVGYGIKTVNGLAPEAVTIAEVFKGAGYRTGLIGKWHLGDAPGMQPMDQGFDTAYYINKSNNQTKKLYRGSELVADPFENRKLTEDFTREAIRFIETNRAHPFLLYLPLTAPHFPAEAHPDWKGTSANEAYGDVVEEMDHRIGEILAALKGARLVARTIVVFISDNGPEPGQKRWARSAPYRGLKWSALEGGTRVPCIVRWPGVVKAGQVSDRLTAAIDLLPTLAHACGIEQRALTHGSPRLDGVNVWPTLAGADTPHARTSLLYWSGWGVPQAIREGDWKLYLDKVKEIAGSSRGPALFNLAGDPAEEKNLAEAHPDRVKKMHALALEQIIDIEEHALALGGPPNKRNNQEKRGAWLKDKP
jgi:arylsulfatase A-like enzyme